MQTTQYNFIDYIASDCLEHLVASMVVTLLRFPEDQEWVKQHLRCQWQAESL